MKPSITLNPGPSTLQCSVDTYAEPGATASDVCDADVPVSIAGSVDDTMVGNYAVTYDAQDDSGNAAPQKTRNIMVVDTLKPSITLNPGPSTLECSVDTYVEPGATASDVCDTDVPVSIAGSVDDTMVGNYAVTYDAQDDSGNAAMQRTRNIMVVDTLKPSITLNPGPSTLECSVDTYVEPGATASDVCDADVPVSIAGSVDETVVGDYAITYDAADDSGNAAVQKTRPLAIRDTTAPVITCPADIATDPVSPDGTVVSFAATSTDLCDSAPIVACPDSGNTFGVGTETVVTCTATDASGNQSSCSLTVKIFSEEEVVANLSAFASALGDSGTINDGQLHSLLVNLRNMLRNVQVGRMAAACGQLQGFISKLNDWVDDGTLTPEEAEPLLISAANLRATLGCS